MVTTQYQKECGIEMNSVSTLPERSAKWDERVARFTKTEKESFLWELFEHECVYFLPSSE